MNIENFVYNIFKPEGITSFDVIRKLRKHLNIKKMGHIGTLDPFAQGVLPIFGGKYTKLIPYFNNSDKEYIASMVIGYSSNTLDREGEIKEVDVPEEITEEKFLKVLNSFKGKIKQVPPMFSAIKHKGKPLYKYAMQGEEIERKEREVTLYDIELLEFNYPNIVFKVHCSKGTYIRVLANDLAAQFGTAAYLKKLTRTKCSEIFTSKHSFELDQVLKNEKSSAHEFEMPFEVLFKEFNQIQTNDRNIEFLENGSLISIPKNEVLKILPDENSYTIVFDNRRKIAAVGSLADSQDSFLRFQPHKVLF